MKKINLSLVAVLLLGAVACNKSNTLAPANSNTGGGISGGVTTDVAADMVAGSISTNSNGVTDMAADATVSAAGFIHIPNACGTRRADTISRASAAGSQYTYSYNLTYNFTVDCNATSQPDSLSSTLNYSGSFSGPNLTSANSGSSVFTVNGLLPTDTAFVINGQYKRSGSFSSKVDTAAHGNNNIAITINALTLKKPSRVIESGNASISITGSTPRRGTFSYTGTLVFNGNGTATLTINGTVYNINLSTGWRQRI